MQSGTEPSLNILLVEDQFIIAKVEILDLNKGGYRVTHARSGELAVEMITSATLPYHLVLMDIDLGEGMNGLETSIKIKTICDIPIIFLSSQTEQSILEKTDHISAYGFVPKNSPSLVMDNAIKMALRLFGANQEISDQKKLYEDLYQNSPCGYHTFSSDGIITRINDTALSLLGYSRDEVISKIRISDLISPMNIDQNHNESLYRIKHINLELFYKRKDETLLPVIFNSDLLYDSEGKIISVRAIFSDISKQLITDYELRKTNYELEVHQIELELQNEELKLRTDNDKLTPERYAIIFDESPLGYISLNPAGEILDLNESCAIILQNERDSLKGQNIFPFLLPESKDYLETFLKNVFLGEFNLTCDLRIKNDKTQFLDVNFRKINVNENDHCFLLIFNISELKQHKSQLNTYLT